MQCLDERRLVQYLRGTLPTSEIVEAGQHVQSCPECRAKLASLVPFKEGAWSVGQVALAVADCPEYEELSAFVDEQLARDAHEEISRHIAVCELCWRDVETMQAARSRASLVPQVAVSPGQFSTKRSWYALDWRKVVAATAAAAAVGAFIIAKPSNEHKPGRDLIATKPTSHSVEPTRGAVKPLDNATTKPAPPPEVNPAVVGTPNYAPKRAPKPTPVSPEQQYVVAMQDGNVTVREAGGKFVATVDEQQLAALVQKKLRDGKVAPSFVVASREDMVRGRAEQVKVSKLSPTPYGLADNKPEFKWGPVDGALKYRVEVYDLDGYNMMPPIETESTSCQSDTALPPGRYKWVVLVSLGARSEWLWSQAQAFRVLSDREQSLIAQAKRTHPDSHLVLGTVYESLGLNDDAVQEFESLQKDNPDSKLAAKLLAGAKSGR